MLACLLQRTVGSCNNEDGTIHLSSTCDHVLYIVSVSGAVNVSIVTVSRFILNVSCVDCDTSCLLFGSVIDLVILEELDVGVCESKSLCDSRGKSCLAVVNVSDCTNVNVGFCSFEFSLCHCKILLGFKFFLFLIFRN